MACRGLRGSGSHDVVVDDVFVPVEDSFSPAPPVAGHSQLAQLPILPVMTAGIGAQFLGMARAAIAVTIEILRHQGVSRPWRIDSRATECARRHRVVQRCGRCRREPPPHQHDGSMGQRQTTLPTAEDRAALYSASLHAAAIARAGVVAMHAAAGTPALYIDCPLERSVRDLHTMESILRRNHCGWRTRGECFWACTDESLIYDLRIVLTHGDGIACFPWRRRFLPW